MQCIMRSEVYEFQSYVIIIPVFQLHTYISRYITRCVRLMSRGCMELLHVDGIIVATYVRSYLEYDSILYTILLCPPKITAYAVTT